MVRIIQIGDLHLDTTSVHLAPDRGAEQRRISRGLFREAVDYANRVEADLLVCTGDLFDTLTPYRDTVDAVSQALEALRCPAVLAAGNHDYLCDRSPYRALRANPNVYLLPAEGEKTVTFPFATVTGRSAGSPHPGGRPLRALTRPEGDKPALAVFHGDPFVSASDYGAFPHEDILRANFDLLMLGHVHIPRWDTVGNTLVTQNGSTEGRGYDEIGQRGFLDITLDKGEKTCCLIPSSGSRAWETEVDVTGLSATQLVEAVTAQCPWPPARTMLRLTVTGQTSMTEPEALARTFLDVKWIDRTAPPAQFVQQTGTGTLRGMVETSLRSALAQAETEEGRRRAALAMEFALAAFENREQPRKGGR